jgi:hypothetical protein
VHLTKNLQGVSVVVYGDYLKYLALSVFPKKFSFRPSRHHRQCTMRTECAFAVELPETNNLYLQ